MLLSTLLTVASADNQWYHYNKDFYVYSECLSTLGKNATFYKKNAIGKCVCTNENTLGSKLYCGYQSTEANNAGINKEISNGCVPYNVTDLTDSYYGDIYAKMLDTIVDVSNSTSFNKTLVVDYPVTSKISRSSLKNSICPSKTEEATSRAPMR